MDISDNVTFGELIYKDIDDNPFLNELYENILYNYSLQLFRIDKIQMEVDIAAALRFADILSKSVYKEKADKHKIWAQEMVALLHALYPQDQRIKHFMGSVLSNTGNYRGMSMITPEYQPGTLLEKLYTGFNKDFLSIPTEPDLQFFRSQKEVYDRLSDPYFSYSGPTSMGKSFVLRMYIKKKIMSGDTMNFAVLVPTKALINEVTSKIINDLKEMLQEYNYRLVTSAGATVLKEDHNFIFVLTPERLLYLLISYPNIQIDYLFIDEAHKISAKDSRSTFYYKVVDMLSLQQKSPHIIFASPNIPNPEVYLDLIPNIENANDCKLASTFAPVSQMKFFIDLVDKDVQSFNSYKKMFSYITRIKEECDFCDVLNYVGNSSQSIVYCSSTAQAVDLALKYANGKILKSDKDLITLSKDIKNEVHDDYYLAELIPKGIAYHIGYLPAAIRMRIEDLFRDGLITTVFCTSTLVEGVNLPADNLFVTSYKNGRSPMNSVDFKNLIGRVGRLEYNLYGNVFLVRLEDKVKSEDFVELLTKDVPEQKLSVTSELKPKHKKEIIKSLLEGNVEFKRLSGQSEESYSLMRKFAIILLRDIVNDRNSRVRKEFEPFLQIADVARIKEAFIDSHNKPDDDINVSIDQANNLTVAVARGLKYPELNENGNIDYSELIDFLETLSRIFKWDKYEGSTLGKRGSNGKHSMLKWYAVILSQWMSGSGLSFITTKAIEYKQEHADSKIMILHKLVPYDNSLEHRNIVIAETLSVIENIVLFSISNYFLRFSTEYKRFHKLETMNNDWYEYVEYGTTNPLTITLQRSGFSRETSSYIKKHKSEYVVVLSNGELKLRKSLLECGNIGVQKETADIIYNIPELFVK
jgi:superfamily II DNA/RNA helicase